MTNLQSSVGEKTIYKRYGSSKHKFMTCNFFADESFRGYIYPSVGDKSCFDIDIAKSPQEFLRNEDLFLQVYPFKIFRDELNYGSAKTIYTVSKYKNSEVLIQSQIIDNHIIQVELELETDHFFLDHSLQVCDIEEEWDGLQLVIYERREGEKEPAPIRITKFLTPPFLIHPEYFKETKGVSLGAYHPFLDFIPELKSEPKAYYELAENLCSRL